MHDACGCEEYRIHSAMRTSATTDKVKIEWRNALIVATHAYIPVKDKNKTRRAFISACGGGKGATVVAVVIIVVAVAFAVAVARAAAVASEAKTGVDKSGRSYC